MRWPTLVLIATLLPSINLLGQSVKSDSLFIQQAKNRAVGVYERAIYRQEHVYEGNEYIPHDHRIKIHPFYPIDTLQRGTIAYNGTDYHDVPMLYDIVRDELSIQPPEGGYRIRIHTNKVSAFSIGPYQFVKILGDSALGAPTGFYQLLHNGSVKVFVRRIKTIHEDISSGAYKADYIPQDRFFILKDGVYHPVKTKGSVLSVFADKGKELKKFIRANQLKFKDLQREEAISRVTQQYEELTHKL
ncbi:MULTISPECIES: hypothetical protein [unclassified Spirosoma]|uniref:hypothetical protein n=1 Tax=unclassified Spirosoma TaxID=2621999 RepID=UPI00096857CD|nr:MULTISPECIES: hypothetical protein [unclassified Spirosoma]MBN8820998.1 hypothetical protein [Spirosoma sp.]OJW76003.1 MAG: hypothetical protein BGO59_04015 [Spirosoma sp. 48-14]